jgi:ATP-binding protein involved in chromosome partitioning
MFGTHERPEVFANKLVPVKRHGLKVMSIGFIVDPKEAMTWRGPMLNGALIQFMRDVDWGDLDYLVLDLPPGTGDVQLTLIQTTPLTGAVVVTTPSDVALEDARKAVNMFEQVREDVLGIVENMSYLEHKGEKLYVFGKGGGARTAEQMRVPLLAEIPLDPQTREGGDSGQPIATRPQPNAQAALFEKLAHTIIERAEVAKQKQRPTITIAD